MIVGREIYVEGRRTGVPEALDELREVCRRRGGLAWIGLENPAPEELNSVAAVFDFPPLAVEDAVEANQRPKMEHYGDILFVVLRPVRYLDPEEKVEFGELHLFVGEDFVVTVRHGGTEPLSEVKERLEAEPELLTFGPMAILYAVLDHVVDGYAPALDGLENDIDEIEAEVFGESAGDGEKSEGQGASPASEVSRRIYGLSREVMLLHRTTRPMVESQEELPLKRLEPEVRHYLRDVRDHATRVNDRTEGLRDLLSDIVSINLAIIGASQTDQNKRISAWAAILIVPTIVTGVYGMNFRFVPELQWRLGYPLALFIIVAISVALYVSFKRRGWL
ncbi:MAG: magnesium and cobalt transport protein CorA [Rubrobacter sp.]